eukprot:762462-Hanusia_phi.AAC.8
MDGRRRDVSRHTPIRLTAEDLPPIQVVVYRGAKAIVQKFPVMTFLYILGLCLMLFATGMMPSEGANEEYSRLLQEAEYETSMVDQLERKVAVQSRKYHESRGFLGFSCDSSCMHAYENLQKLQKQLHEAKSQQFKALSEAKSKVGIFSLYAVEEARELFWGTFAQGKGFAKRASMWDLLFMGLGSMGRDEGLASFILRFVIQVLFNFTLGLVGALVAFIWYLWDVVRSYQPDPVTAVISFLLFSIAAISMVATYLIALYGSVAASGYMIVRTAVLGIDNGSSGSAPRAHIGGGSPGDDDIFVGKRVRVVGLSSRPEYNGRLGMITGQEGDRILVQLDFPSETLLKLKPSNIDAHVD